MFFLLVFALSFKQAVIFGSVPAAALPLLGLVAALLAPGVADLTLQRDPAIRGAALVFVSLMAGSVLALFVAPQGLVLREIAAYGFTFLIVCGALRLRLHHGDRLASVAGHVIGLALLGLYALALLPTPLQIRLWYEDAVLAGRLQGFSDNPNQIAFLGIAGLALLTLADLRQRSARPLTIIAACGCCSAGLLAQSDAFVVAIILLAVVLLAVVLLTAVTRASPVGGTLSGLSLGRHAFPLAAITACAMTAAVFAIGAILPSLAQGLLMTPPDQAGAMARAAEGWESLVEGDARQGSVRFALWADAASRIAQAPVFGYGAGYHAALPGIGEAMEAHNTLLDLGLVAGGIGLAALAALLAVILRAALGSGRLAWIALALAPLFAYAMFHHVGRQPLFWIVIALAALAAVGDRRIRPRDDARPRA